jgi:hypothetical protein
MHHPGTRRMQLAPAMAFDNLGAFILRHHPLALEQEIIFRAAPQFAVEEHHLDTHALEFIH